MGAVERVRQRLAASAHGIEIVHLDKDTRTAELAAQALGTAVGAIVKSLVFIADDEVVLALVAGDKRADGGRLAAALGAEAGAHRARRGGQGTHRLRHWRRAASGRGRGRGQVRTLMDESLYRYDTVYAAAGSPFDIFPVAPESLRLLTGADVVGLAED